MMTKNGKITWANEQRKLSDLIPWDINPATISKDAAKRLEESLDEFGQVETIAISPNNEIYDGHQRQVVWGASAKFGADYIVDVRVSSRELTERERKKLVIFLRKGTVGQFDFDMLANNWELDDLLEWGFDKKELDIDLWAGNQPEDPGAQIDKAEELREKWGVESGQLWKLGEHRLICGDCTDRAVVERVMQGEKADMVFTDPPYNIGLKEWEDNRDNNEYAEFIKNWFGIIQENCLGSIFITPGIANVSLWFSLFKPDWIFAWLKMNGMSRNAMGGPNKWEPILGYHLPYEQGIDVIDAVTDRIQNMHENHPTIKPVKMVEDLSKRFSKKLLFEPFLGSGTTLIACERLHRKCRAIEISPAYCAVAIQRWVDMTGGIPELLQVTEINNNGKSASS